MELREIAIKDIRTGLHELRDPGSGDIEGLGDSLKQVGQRVPVYVKPNGTGYELLYGHRRVRAAKQAGMKIIVAEVAAKDINAVEILLSAITENLAREDMTPLEKGKALAALKAASSWDISDISAKVGLSQQICKRLISLSAEPQSVQRVMENPGATGVGPLTTRHVEPFSSKGAPQAARGPLRSAVRSRAPVEARQTSRR